MTIVPVPHALSDREPVATMVPAVAMTVPCLAVALVVPSTGVAVLLIAVVLGTLVGLRVGSVARSTEGVG